MQPQIKFDILTLFPPFFTSPLKESILGRSIKNNIIEVKTHNLRTFAKDPRKTVDDKPYGGGEGMVLRLDILVSAIENIGSRDKPYTILLDPKGNTFSQRRAEKLSRKKRILLVCGHYEGVDQRFAESWTDEVLSIGDYILSGGETAALVLVDSITRLVSGSLGNIKSTKNESFSRSDIKGVGGSRILDFPVYTRPETFRGKKVPRVLLSGDHEKINTWRRNKSLEMTRKTRPDLITSR